MKGRRISDWQYSLAVRLLHGGATFGRAADEVGVCAQTVAKIAREHGIVRKRGSDAGRRSPTRKPEHVRHRALGLIRQGLTLRAAATETGVSHETINLWAKAEGVQLARSKQSWRIRKQRGISLLRKGVSVVDIADQLGVCVATVHGWRRAAGLEWEGDRQEVTPLPKVPACLKKKGRPPKQPRPVSLATITGSVTTETASEATLTDAQRDVLWLREDMERRRRQAKKEREKLLSD